MRDTEPAGGSVINAASFLAEVGAATAQMAYAAAKAGVVQLSRDLGVHLARLEVKVVLAALARRVRRFELAGEPRRIRSNFTNGLATLPVRIHR